MADFVAGRVTKISSAGEGGFSLYMAYRAATIVAGSQATVRVGGPYKDAGTAERAVEGAIGDIRLVWRRTTLNGGVESYEGVTQI